MSTPKFKKFNIEAYKPGKSKINKIKKVIKLSANESALGMSPLAKKAISKKNLVLDKYPDGKSTNLKIAISKAYKCNFDKIVCGAGSDEVIQMLCQLYLHPKDEVIVPQYSFLMYRIYAKIVGAKVVFAKENNFKVSIEEILKKVSKKTKIVFIANPNNPTGTYLTKKETLELRRKLNRNILLVIDDAYSEYMKNDDYSSGLELFKNKDNVFILRTFSKMFGLASLRIGWGYCPIHIIEVLNKIRGPFNLSTASILAGAAALSDQEHVMKSVQFNIEEKKILLEKYKELGVDVIDGVANFILLNFSTMPDLEYEQLKDFLISNKVYLRDVADYGLPHHLRLSIGSKENNIIAFDKIAGFLRK